MLLFPDVGLDKRFIGLAKSEPERFEKFGKLVIHVSIENCLGLVTDENWKLELFPERKIVN